MKLVPIPCPLAHTARCRDGTVAVMEIATMKKLKAMGINEGFSANLWHGIRKGSFAVNESLRVGKTGMNPQQVGVYKSLFQAGL